MTDHVHERTEGAARREDVETDDPASQVAPDTDQDMQTLRDELVSAQEEAASNHDKYLRARAEMDNYKKRVERTYADLARSGKKDLLRKLLSIRDNLERAIQYADTGEAGGESLMEGVRLTSYQLEQMLEQEGVRPIDAQGKPFDPHIEEALQSIDDPSVPDHTVVQVVRPGYTYEDEVLRPAQVIVNVHGAES